MRTVRESLRIALIICRRDEGVVAGGVSDSGAFEVTMWEGRIAEVVLRRGPKEI